MCCFCGHVTRLGASTCRHRANGYFQTSAAKLHAFATPNDSGFMRNGSNSRSMRDMRTSGDRLSTRRGDAVLRGRRCAVNGSERIGDAAGAWSPARGYRVGWRHLPRAFARPPQPAPRCFPSASPTLTQRPGKQKAAPKDRSKLLIFLRKSGAGEGIRTLDPNLGKVMLYP